MKRSPLQRKTPLKARTALRATTTRLAPVSADRKAHSAARSQTRETVFARDQRCQAIGRLPGRCWGPLTYHHLRKASAGGAYDEANGLALCAGHNRMVEDEPDKARAVGLVR